MFKFTFVLDDVTNMAFVAVAWLLWQTLNIIRNLAQRLVERLVVNCYAYICNKHESHKQRLLHPFAHVPAPPPPLPPRYPQRTRKAPERLMYY